LLRTLFHPGTNGGAPVKGPTPLMDAQASPPELDWGWWLHTKSDLLEWMQEVAFPPRGPGRRSRPVLGLVHADRPNRDSLACDPKGANGCYPRVREQG